MGRIASWHGFMFLATLQIFFPSSYILKTSSYFVYDYFNWLFLYSLSQLLTLSKTKKHLLIGCFFNFHILIITKKTIDNRIIISGNESRMARAFLGQEKINSVVFAHLIWSKFNLTLWHTGLSILTELYNTYKYYYNNNKKTENILRFLHKSLYFLLIK